MNKVLYTVFAIFIAIIGYNYFINNDTKAEENLGLQKAKYSNSEIGLEFEYPIGPNGYVVDERIPADFGDLVRVIILHRTEDAKNDPPVASEGAPVITVVVFNNTEKQFPRVWADQNIQDSTINLKQGDVSEAVVGGANAIRYMADGLYPSENVVVAHGQYMYVVKGQFLDQNSDLRRDFAPLVGSIKFIPQPGQE